MKNRINGLLALSAFGAAALVACGGGGGGSGSGDVTLSGLAATGAAIANGSVAVQCVSGAGTATTAADGTFTVRIPAPATAPCLVKVTKNGVALYSVATAAGRVNVTPITDLLVNRAAGGDPSTAFNSLTADRANQILSGLDAARTYVRTQVAALGGGTVTGDPLTKPFAIGDTDDKVLDSLGAALTARGVTVENLRLAAQSGSALADSLEETRPHDTFAYKVNAADAAATTFAAMPAAAGDTVDMATTTRWAGVLNGAAYRIEVPANWNGELVMYAHGYAGEGLTLNAVNSSIRRFLIQQGYAWAASSYSKNSYDVRAGIEDTNRLALNFNDIATTRGRALAKPGRTWIIGHSMGGHIAAAAVEAETYATAVNKVRYDGSMPMCGVVGDTTLFDTFAAMQAAAHVLGGSPTVPLDQWSAIKTQVTGTLFTNFGAAAGTPLTPNGSAGQAYYSALQNLTGGPRPLFGIGYAYGRSFEGGPYPNFGTTTVTTGLTTQPTADTDGIVYKVDGQDALSAQINATAPKATAPATANRLRRDGLRWIPKVNGQLQTPVLTLHTLGDLFVPFNMEQVYRQRATAAGTGNLLVQRAIRGATHCDFTNAEMQKGFTDLVAWVKQGTKPAGDDVLTPATVAAPTYGCNFTNDTLNPTDEPATSSTAQLRGLIAQANQSCAAVSAPAPAAP